MGNKQSNRKLKRTERNETEKNISTYQIFLVMAQQISGNFLYAGAKSLLILTFCNNDIIFDEIKKFIKKILSKLQLEIEKFSKKNLI